MPTVTRAVTSPSPTHEKSNVPTQQEPSLIPPPASALTTPTAVVFPSITPRDSNGTVTQLPTVAPQVIFPSMTQRDEENQSGASTTETHPPLTVAPTSASSSTAASATTSTSATGSGDSRESQSALRMGENDVNNTMPMPRVSMFTPDFTPPPVVACLSECNIHKGALVLEECTLLLESLPKSVFPTTMTKDEALAIILYTYDFFDPVLSRENIFFRLNRELHWRRESLFAWRTFLWHLINGLRKTARYKGVVYRGIHSRVDLDGYAKGKTVVWHSFSSTTTSLASAQSFMKDPAECTLFFIETLCGWRVGKLSFFPCEEEIILEAGTQFVVSDRTLLCGVPVVHLRQLPMALQSHLLIPYIDTGDNIIGSDNSISDIDNLFSGSKIISLVQMQQVNQWVRDIGQVTANKWKLLWQGTTDGFQSKTFHRLCDNHGSTILFVKTTKNYVFGGFTPLAWTPEGAGPPWIGGCGGRSFLFSLLRNGTTSNVALRCVHPTHRQCIRSHQNHGPSYGTGPDLHITSDCHEEPGSCSLMPDGSYEPPPCEAEERYLAGTSKSWIVEDIEMWEPVAPSTTSPSNS
ncbi:hypothetical protein Pelo_13667 [Pelomyxa schiedti]|nr:hypothetical protein Pelo_13667 [Pelomyxa schiedti]